MLLVWVDWYYSQYFESMELKGTRLQLFLLSVLSDWIFKMLHCKNSQLPKCSVLDPSMRKSSFRMLFFSLYPHFLFLSATCSSICNHVHVYCDFFSSIFCKIWVFILCVFITVYMVLGYRSSHYYYFNFFSVNTTVYWVAEWICNPQPLILCGPPWGSSITFDMFTPRVSDTQIA